MIRWSTVRSAAPIARVAGAMARQARAALSLLAGTPAVLSMLAQTPAVLLMLADSPAMAQESGEALREVTYRETLDGDTFRIDDPAGVLGEVGGLEVRIRGIDAPAFTLPCPDPAERTRLRRRALRAATFLQMALTEASRIDLLDVTRDEAGRLLARVLVDGRDVGAAMLRAGLAQPMEGDTQPEWCGK